MTIDVAMKLIDLGFTTEQIKAFETPDTPPTPTEPVFVTNEVDKTWSREEPKEVQPSPTVTPEPIDYKKLAEEVALYNQRNAIVPPEEPKVVTPTEPVHEPSAQEVLLNFLG